MTRLACSGEPTENNLQSDSISALLSFICDFRHIVLVFHPTTLLFGSVSTVSLIFDVQQTFFGEKAPADVALCLLNVSIVNNSKSLSS